MFFGGDGFGAHFFLLDHFGGVRCSFFVSGDIPEVWVDFPLHPGEKTSTKESSLSEDVGDSQKVWEIFHIKQTEKGDTILEQAKFEWSPVDPGIDPRSSRSTKKIQRVFFLDACYAYGCHWQKLANSGQWPKIGRLRKGPFFWAEKKGRWVLRSLHEVGAVFVQGGKKVGGSKTCLCYASDSGWWWRDQISEVCSTWFFRNFSTW